MFQGRMFISMNYQEQLYQLVAKKKLTMQEAEDLLNSVKDHICVVAVSGYNNGVAAEKIRGRQ